jgi:hypothetical protein
MKKVRNWFLNFAMYACVAVWFVLMCDFCVFLNWLGMPLKASVIITLGVILTTIICAVKSLREDAVRKV